MVALADRPARTRARPRARTYTPEEFEALEDSVAYELRADGTLEERCMSWKSETVVAKATFLLLQNDEHQQYGVVASSGLGLQIFTDRPRRIPRADFTWVARARVPEGGPGDGFLRIAPDLVGEVVSPGDKAVGLDRKVQEYLSAGVRLVWVIYPDTRSVWVFRASSGADYLGPGDTLSGEDVVPGFAVPVSALFEGT